MLKQFLDLAQLPQAVHLAISVTATVSRSAYLPSECSGRCARDAMAEVVNREIAHAVCGYP
jgi:hypothetical protein